MMPFLKIKIKARSVHSNPVQTPLRTTRACLLRSGSTTSSSLSDTANCEGETLIWKEKKIAIELRMTKYHFSLQLLILFQFSSIISAIRQDNFLCRLIKTRGRNLIPHNFVGIVIGRILGYNKSEVAGIQFKEDICSLMIMVCLSVSHRFFPFYEFFG